MGNSVRMEKEGFERSLSFLEGKGVVVKAVVTDQHTGVQKFLREQRPGISHYFDPWHMGKGKCLNWEKKNNKKRCLFFFFTKQFARFKITLFIQREICMSFAQGLGKKLMPWPR